MGLRLDDLPPSIRAKVAEQAGLEQEAESEPISPGWGLLIGTLVGAMMWPLVIAVPLSVWLLGWEGIFILLMLWIWRKVG